MAETLGVTSESFSFDNLIYSDVGLVTRDVTIEAGQNLTRGSLIGRKTKAAGTPSADPGNTGDGTVTGFTLGKNAKLGNYTLE